MDSPGEAVPGLLQEYGMVCLQGVWKFRQAIVGQLVSDQDTCGALNQERVGKSVEEGVAKPLGGVGIWEV